MVIFHAYVPKINNVHTSWWPPIHTYVLCLIEIKKERERGREKNKDPLIWTTETFTEFCCQAAAIFLFVVKFVVAAVVVIAHLGISNNMQRVSEPANLLLFFMISIRYFIHYECIFSFFHGFCFFFFFLLKKAASQVKGKYVE